MTVRKTQPGRESRAILRTIVVTTPNAKIILKTLKASTLPGNIFPMSAPVFVCKKVSEIPHSADTAKQRPYA